MNTPQPQPEREAEFDFAPLGFHNNKIGKSIDIVQFLFSIWKPLAIGLCLGVLAGIAVYLYLGPVYAAQTQVLVSKKASVPLNSGEANRYGERGEHLELIKTDVIIERAIDEFGLKEVPAIADAYDPVKEVSESLSVSRSAGQESSFDNILDLEFLHPDKDVAKAVVISVVEAYKAFLDDTRNENSKQIYELLIDRKDLLDEEILTLEKEYQEFRKQAPVFLKASPVVTINGMPTQAPSRFESELAEIEKAQNENLRRRASIQAKIATLDRMLVNNTSRETLEFWVMHSLSTGSVGDGKGGGSGLDVSGPPAKAVLDQQLLTARILEQKLLHSLGPDHSSVKTVRMEIDTILDFYTRQGLRPPKIDAGDSPLSSRSASLGMDLVSVYRQTLEEQLEELRLDDEKLALLHDDAQSKAKDAEMIEIEDQRRKDEIALKKEQAKQAFQQIAAYDVSKEQEGYRLKQIAQVRVERSLKRVIKIVGVFGIMGAAAVFCLAYFREWMDTSMKTLDEVRETTGSQVMAAVPKFASSIDADRLAGESGISPALCYFHRPGSMEAEAFRSVRTTLFFAMPDGDQIVQVSSAEPGDGKSTVAANLAIAIAQSGKTVLLVDGDLRRPTQHHLFGVSQEIGLTDVLLREIDWINAVRATPVKGLSLMVAGLCPDNPSELLSTPTLPQFLSQARSHYDVVMIDSPPVLAVSDPSIMSPHCDGMLLVVRMNKNKRPTIQRSRETLAAHGVKLYGVVANDFDTDSAGNAGYDFDSYGSYYRDRPQTEQKPVPVPPAPAVMN